MNAEIHGNWTLENGKGRLHQFLQMNRIQMDYKYSMIGPDHNRYSRYVVTQHIMLHLFCLAHVAFNLSWRQYASYMYCKWSWLMVVLYVLGL